MFELKNWSPLNSNSSFSTIWLLKDVFEFNSNSDLQFDLEFIDETGGKHSLRINKINECLFGIKKPKFGYEFEEAVLEVLQGQLSSCEELLKFDPDCKCN